MIYHNHCCPYFDNMLHCLGDLLAMALLIEHQEKKNLPMHFSLRHMCYWHVLGAIGRPLAGHWQVGQQIGCQLLNTLPISWQWYKWHNWVDALLPKAAICDIFMGCNIHMCSYLINCNA